MFRTSDRSSFFDTSDKVDGHLGTEAGLLEDDGGDVEDEFGLSDRFVFLEFTRSEV